MAGLSRKRLLRGVMTSRAWNDLKHGPVSPGSCCPTPPGGASDHDGPAFKTPVSSWGWQNPSQRGRLGNTGPSHAARGKGEHMG